MCPLLPEACSRLHEKVQYTVKTGKDHEGLTYSTWELEKGGRVIRDFF